MYHMVGDQEWANSVDYTCTVIVTFAHAESICIAEVVPCVTLYVKASPAILFDAPVTT
jgi:hypothetical protein